MASRVQETPGVGGVEGDNVTKALDTLKKGIWPASITK